MAVNININFNGVGSPTVSGLGDRSLAWEEPKAYPLLPGFTSTETLLSRAKGKAKKKGKKCEKGQVCGLSCIAKTKTCIANMTLAQLMEHNKAKRAERRAKAQAKKAAAGGAVGGEKGGEIVLLNKKEAEQATKKPRFAGDRQREIDEKYASINPSGSDVDAWLKETVDNMNTPAGIEAIAAMDMLRGTFPSDPAAIPYLDKVNGEKGFVEAYASLIAGKYKDVQKATFDGKTYKDTDIEYWRQSFKPFPEETKKFEQAQRLVNNPKKTAEQKEKAQKIIDKYQTRLDDQERLAQDWLERTTKLRSGDREFALKMAQEAWDREIGQTREKIESDFKFLNSKSKAKQELGRDVLQQNVNMMYSPSWWMKPGSPDNLKDFTERLQAKAAKLSPLSEATSKAELKKLFKEFAVANHPDKGGDVKLFQKISAEYSELLTYLN